MDPFDGSSTVNLLLSYLATKIPPKTNKASTADYINDDIPKSVF